MEYFFDNSISHRIVAALRALSVDTTALRDEFPENITDVQLFEAISGREITFVATDMKQLTREHEAEALRAAGISAIYFGPFWSKLELWSQAAWIVKHWPTIDGYVTGAAKGTVAEIKHNGRAQAMPI